MNYCYVSQCKWTKTLNFLEYHNSKMKAFIMPFMGEETILIPKQTFIQTLLCNFNELEIKWACYKTIKQRAFLRSEIQMET